MTSKEARLKKRLDDLENELKSLHARVTRKHQPYSNNFFKSPNELSTDSKAKNNVFKTEANRKKNKVSLEEKGQLKFNDECWSYLRNISKNIAKGSDAIHKIASLTEISSLSGRADGLKSIENGFSDDEFIFRSSGAHGDHHSQKKKSKFVKNNNANSSLKRQFSRHLYEPNKNQNRIRFSPTVVKAPLTPPTKEKNVSSGLESLKNEMEDRLIDLQILKEKIDIVKKKLRDERSKREIAEKAIASYRRRIALLEGKKSKDDNINAADSRISNQVAKITSVEKELKAEYHKRTEAEKKVNELIIALEETKLEIAKLNESKNMALKMADTFRERSKYQDTQEFGKLKADNAALQEELYQLKHKAGLVDSLIERAERAENELIQRMKQCNVHMAKSSLNDQEVQEVIQRHKAAYVELEMEMKFKEAEMRNQCVALDKQLQEAKSYSDKKYKELLEKYNQTVTEIEILKNNEEALKTERSALENQVVGLSKRLKDITETNENLEKTITSLRKTLQDNKDETEKLKVEYTEKKVVYSELQKKLNEIEEGVNDKEQTIESLRIELESEKDIIRIKDKMLQDQADTIKCLRTVSDNTKKTLDDERAQKSNLKEEVDKLQISHESLKIKLSKLEKQLKESEEIRASLRKRNETLKHAEKDFSMQKEALENKITDLTCEKSQAMRTARFATEKLVVAIHEYELKLDAQKKLQNILNDALREKEYQLDIANQQINELNEELWKSAQLSEQIKSDLKSKLKMACEVCTDVLDIQIDRDF